MYALKWQWHNNIKVPLVVWSVGEMWEPVWIVIIATQELYYTRELSDSYYRYVLPGFDNKFANDKSSVWTSFRYFMLSLKFLAPL